MSKRFKTRPAFNRKRRNNQTQNSAPSLNPSTIHDSPKTKILLAAIELGLTAKTVLAPGEDEDLLLRLAGSFLAIHQPADDSEFLLVEEMVAAKWKLRQSWAAENALMKIEIIRQERKAAETFLHPGPDVVYALALRELTDNSKCLAHIHRQQARYARMHDRALQQLRISQALRLEQEAASTVENVHTPDGPATEPSTNSNEINLIPTENTKIQNNPDDPKIYPQPEGPPETPDYQINQG